MSYPQPSSVEPVLNGRQYFRLNTTCLGPGDIYESEVGSLGLVVGPDSDFARYLVSYYDEKAVGGVGNLILSPDRSTIGRIDARNDVVYNGGQSRKGRILYSIADIYDPQFSPVGFDIDNDVMDIESPTIDVIQYFINPPSVIPQRSDRVFQWQYFSVPVATHSAWLVIPAYGRKSGWFTFNNLGAASVDIAVFGVKLSSSASPGPVGAFQQSLFAATVGAGASNHYAFRSSTDGLWDLFAIKIKDYAGQALPLSVTLSDDLA
jgi:hypothetical protein